MQEIAGLNLKQKPYAVPWVRLRLRPSHLASTPLPRITLSCYNFLLITNLPALWSWDLSVCSILPSPLTKEETRTKTPRRPRPLTRADLHIYIYEKKHETYLLKEPFVTIPVEFS